jgi:hypothetical protein
MIESVISHINTQIETLNIHSRLFGLCEIIKKVEKSFPAEFCKGEYKQVSDFDKGGTVYHRIIGDISTEESDKDTAVSCDPFYEKTYPMKIVSIVKKRNNAYSDLKISDDLIKKIAFSNNKTLRTALFADQVSSTIKNISLDRDQILSTEFIGYPNFLDYEYSVVSIEYDITITGNLSCFQLNGCNEY